jgi:hypothetical protein
MRVRQDKLETHHLTCMMCGALPDTTCIDEDQARADPSVTSDEHRGTELAVRARMGAAGTGEAAA